MIAKFFLLNLTLFMLVFPASASVIRQMPYQYSYDGLTNNDDSSTVFVICEDCSPAAELRRAFNVQLSIRVSGNQDAQGGVASDPIKKENSTHAPLEEQ
jgi:hypothetical protein